MAKGSHESAVVALNVPNASSIVRLPSEPAAAAVAELRRGGRVCGLTMGQFSLLDLIRAVLAKTGPADVLISTWTAGIRDAETAAWLLSGEEIRSLRFVVDRSFATRQPRYAQRMIELFGERAILATRTHAKFAVVQNESWSVAIRSSMNLNKNTRVEQFDIDDDAALCRLFSDYADRVAAAQPAGLDVIEDAIQEGLASMGSTAADPEDWERFLPRELRAGRVAEPLAPPSASPRTVEAGGYLGELEELERCARQSYLVAAEAGSNASGIANLLRQWHQLKIAVREERNRLADEQRAERDTGPVTEDEMVEQAVAELAQLPDPLLDRVLSGLVDAGRGPAVRRNAPPGLRVVGD